jgi:hypothetical protein
MVSSIDFGRPQSINAVAYQPRAPEKGGGPEALRQFGFSPYDSYGRGADPRLGALAMGWLPFALQNIAFQSELGSSSRNAGSLGDSPWGRGPEPASWRSDPVPSPRSTRRKRRRKGRRTRSARNRRTQRSNRTERSRRTSPNGRVRRTGMTPRELRNNPRSGIGGPRSHNERGIPNGLRPNAANGARLVRQMGFTGTIGGIGARGRKSDHPHGNAIDVMVQRDTRMGRQVAEQFRQNHQQLGVKYVIYQQHIASPRTGWRWQPMRDRGSPTENHMDHVHISFY